MANATDVQQFLTQNQLDHLREITNDGQSNYAQGYEYIHGMIGESDNVSDEINFWFQGGSHTNVKACQCQLREER